MILAAGLGTRLRPLTDHCPKALVPIGDRSVLAHVAEKLRGFDRIVVNAHHHADQIERAAGALGLGCSVEADLLGTAGGIAKARRENRVDGDVVVWNADILGAFALPFELRGLATLLVKKCAKGEGNVGIDAGGRIVRLRQTRIEAEMHGGEFVGVHAISRDLELPEKGCIVGDVYLKVLGRIHAELTDVEFIDVGSPDGYRAANLAWVRARGGTWVGEGAKVSCALEDSIVGAGATASGDGALVRCVVWPGAHATAPLADAVVTR
jgi:NDP-sugar pyrophosphorylase family protein